MTTPPLPRKTFAEFFAGIGLMRMGLERQGWSLAFANDIDPQKYAMYQAHFEDTDRHFCLKDVHELSADDVPTVSLATASFPCTDLSLAGSRSGLNGKQSGAFWGFMSILQNLRQRRPALVLLENVTGFLTSDGGEDFRQALLALNRLGYRVDAFIIDAARFVPHSRPRLFVVGKQGKVAAMESGLSLDRSDCRPKAIVDFILMHPEIHWAIRSLPSLPHGTIPLEGVLEDLPDEAPEWWNTDRAAYFLSQMSPRHRAIADQMMSGRQWQYGTAFRRVRHGRSMAELRTDGLAGCLRTPKGGSGRQILFKAGFGRYAVRLLTPRECAALMGAGDYKINAPLNQALFGFGDAVCVPVVEWIAQHYLQPALAELSSPLPLPAYPASDRRERRLVHA